MDLSTASAEHLADRAANAFANEVAIRELDGMSLHAAITDTLAAFRTEYPNLAAMMAGALLGADR
jgi:hypothetical protein